MKSGRGELGVRVIVPDVVCDQCQQPLIEIDLYGRRWIGCIDCNLWSQPGDSLVRALSEEDIAAIRQRHRGDSKKRAPTLADALGQFGMQWLRPM